MNTNNLKRFAQETRRKLLEQVGSRLTFILDADTAQLREKTDQIKQLREELNRTPREQLIEKVAYTWFNRLMALRFMDANDYQPLGIRIITPKDGYTIPELLDEAKKGNIPEGLRVDIKRVFALLDNEIPSANPQNEAYKDLLIAACNHLNSVLPFLFERINDFTELLLPEDLTSDFSVVTDIREGMSIEDCKFVEIIGWLYQFYISEQKDILINAKKRYKPHEIAPVTQLFTPEWIVKYMVDNTLGHCWMEARPKSTIINDLKFYIKPNNEEILQKREIKSPEDITFFDPCVGSAHVLCYGFEIFYKIYEEEGYDISVIPKLIIEKNLFGTDIDERAAQLSGFALMMKGRQYDKKFLKKSIIPNILAFENSTSLSKFQNAQTHGSLIQIESKEVENILVDDNSIFSQQQSKLKKQATYLASKYDIVVTNPPYLNSTYMDGELKQFIEKEYQSTKSDLFACFLVQATRLAKEDGFIGFIAPFVWMFISSFEKLRFEVINNTTISSLIQLEYNAFEPACVPVATFTLRNKHHFGVNGTYIKLSDFKGYKNQEPKVLEAIANPNCGWLFTANQNDFKKIPSYPIGYWMSQKTIDIFDKNKSIGSISPVRKGNSTSNNHRFLRLWFETEDQKNAYNYHNIKSINEDNRRWVPYNKGGGFRKWYGFQEFLIDWKNNAEEIRSIPTSVITNEKFYMKRGLTWSTITSYKFSIRFFNEGFIFDNGGCCIFIDNEELRIYIMGLLNSNSFDHILAGINPTLNYQSGEVSKFPVKLDLSNQQLLTQISKCGELSKLDWDSYEVSWEFNSNELLKLKRKDETTIEDCLELLFQLYHTKFCQLHNSEEFINNQFVKLYCLQEELTPFIPLQDITILQEEIDRKSLEKLNNKLIRDHESMAVLNYGDLKLPFIAEEILAQFISYSVGCMFGRYSLDKNGIILANQGENLNDYFRKTGIGITDAIFLPDGDNIIPVLEDEWFEDDIVARFYQFLKVTFGEKYFNKNLSTIEECIGKDIRKYFLRDFYPDHIKRYKKRPIYWMFSSPKGSFNVLIYLHRYTPDTISIILNKYLRDLISKLKSRKEHLSHISEVGSPAEKTRALREMDSNEKILIELRDYERDTLYPLAIERLTLDLDDGVLVNYNKFGKAIKEVVGLNDPATKKKVREFDWIDTSQIR